MAFEHGREERPGGRGAGVLVGLGAAWVAGAVLRLWNLPAQVVSDDEIHTVRAVLAMPVSEILTSYGKWDYSLPMAALYRALSDAGVRLTEMLLRLLPLAAGLAVPVAVPLWLRPRLGGRAAVWLAWLLAVSTPLVYYSRVVRPYSWSVLLALVAVAGFAAWWSGGRTRSLVAFAGAGALALWFLPVVAPFVGAPLVWGAAGAARRRDPAAVRRLVLAAAALAVATGALFAPAASDLLEVVSDKAGRRVPGAESWLEALQLHAGSRNVAVAAAVWVLVAGGVARHLRRDRGAALYWLLAMGLQALAVQVAAPLGVGQPFVLERYLLMTLPVILAWAAFALATPIRRRELAVTRDLAGGFLVVALVATGPFADPAFRRSPFMHHKDHLELHAAPARLPPGARPAVYGALLESLPPGPVLEYPWLPVWQYTDALRLYQEAHGREVVAGAVAPKLRDARLAFRNMVGGTPESFLASRARFLLLHRDYGAEEARVVEPEWPAEKMRRGFPPLLRRWAGRRSKELRRLWGPPDWVDGSVEVWDLERVRATPRAAANR